MRSKRGGTPKVTFRAGAVLRALTERSVATDTRGSIASRDLARYYRLLEQARDEVARLAVTAAEACQLWNAVVDMTVIAINHDTGKRQTADDEMRSWMTFGSFILGERWFQLSPLGQATLLDLVERTDCELVRHASVPYTDDDIAAAARATGLMQEADGSAPDD